MRFAEFFNAAPGRVIFYKGKTLKEVEKFHLTKKRTRLRLTFISTRSRWKQGIMMSTKGFFECQDPPQKIPRRAVLWEDIVSPVTELTVISRDKILYLYNGWRDYQGVGTHMGLGAALYTEQEGAATLFYCNDVDNDEDFDDLIFKVNFLDD